MPDSKLTEPLEAQAVESDAAWSETTVRVRYAETDAMGVAYHSNHIVWFEVGRVELFRSRGKSYREMESDGYHLTVGEVRCRYHSPARYDDLLTVRARVKSGNARLIKFEYEILGEDGARVATGETMHIVTGRDGKARPLAEKYLALLKTPA